MASQAHASKVNGGAASRRMRSRAFLSDSVAARQENLRPRHQSVARRVKKRLVPGVAVLALFGLSVWIIPAESPGMTSSPSVDTITDHRIEKSQDRFTATKPALAIQSIPQMPSWLLGALYAPPPALPSLRPRPGHQ